MSKIGIIIEREYMTRVYKKSFIIMTLAIPFIFIALIAGTLLLSQIKDKEAKEIAVIDYTDKFGQVLKDTESYKFLRVEDIGEESASNYYKSSGRDIYAILTITGDLIENPKQITLFSEKTLNMGLKKDISNQLNPYLSELKIESYNIPDLKRIVADSKVSIDIDTVKWDIEGGETKSSAELASIIGMVFTFLIYMFIFAYGGMVMQAVIQEKTNRIVEVMVSSVKPFELMMGKIIGIAFVGLTQFLIWMAIIIGACTALGIGASASEIKDIATVGMEQQMMNQQMLGGGAAMADPGIIADINGMIQGVNFSELIACFVIYFIGGYLLYASLFAAIGSLVDQEADTQQFMMPVTLIIMFAFYTAIYSIENPDGPLAFWCSVIPLTSPIVMMVRLPYDVPLWQLFLSIGL